MTDNSGTRWRKDTVGVLAAATSVLVAACVSAYVLPSDPADADTVLTSVTQGVVVLPDGSEHSARIGESLPRGAVLRTGPTGGGRLTAAGRDVYVGAMSTVQVLDGVREVLQRGQVMVDARDGAGLRLTVGGAPRANVVEVVGGALARVERAAVLRVGVFRGVADVTAVGRQARTEVPALHQTTAQYGDLPANPSALFLRKDTWERRLAADLTSADDDLVRLADGLRGAQGAVVVAAARSALVRAAQDPSSATDRGEQALSIALAEVGRASADPVTNLGTVRTARTEGGSWGVAAGLVRAGVTDVTGRLSQSLDAEEDTPVVAVPTVRPVVPGVPNSASPRPTRPPGTSRPTPRPTTSRPPTTPPTEDPGPVEQLITTINDLLPTPLPTLAPPRLPGVSGALR